MTFEHPSAEEGDSFAIAQWGHRLGMSLFSDVLSLRVCCGDISREF